MTCLFSNVFVNSESKEVHIYVYKTYVLLIEVSGKVSSFLHRCFLSLFFISLVTYQYLPKISITHMYSILSKLLNSRCSNSIIRAEWPRRHLTNENCNSECRDIMTKSFVAKREKGISNLTPKKNQDNGYRYMLD